MSPYRIIADGQVYSIAINTRDDGQKRIYVLHKPYIDDVSKSYSDKLMDQLDLAYSMNTRDNSTIVASYSVERSMDSKGYNLYHISMEGANQYFDLVKSNLKTLSMCQLAVGDHYCNTTGIAIDMIL